MKILLVNNNPVLSSICVLVVFYSQLSSPRQLPLEGVGKVQQAACGGTQVAILNGKGSVCSLL